MNNDLTLLIPAKNEKESLPFVIREIEKLKLNCKFLFVVEKTDIHTIKVIKKYKKKLIFQVKKGYGDALITGIKKIKTKYFCIFNADGSFVPSELTKMYNILETQNIDFVFGSRYMKEGYSEDDTFITLVGNKIFSFMGKLFFSLNISDILYTFVMGKATKAVEINLIEKDFAFCVELPIKAKRNGFNLISLPYHERPRIAGKKKVNAFKDGFLILTSMIKMFFQKILN